MPRKIYDRFFINLYMSEHYEVTPGVTDCQIMVPALKWRSRLRQITPRVAEQMLRQGSVLIRRK